jgi:hypothetical protein
MGDVVLADGATTEAATEDFAVDVASVAVDAPMAEADVVLVEADMATVEVGAEAVPTVVGAGRFSQYSKLSRPTAFAVGRFVGSYRPGPRERF